MKANTIESVSKEKCTGCGACFNICPVSAITMKENFEGFLYPEIDISKCIECGACRNKCPIENSISENNNEPLIYASFAEDEIRMKSSSGGIFTLLAEYVLSLNGKVCGAAFDNDFRGVHHEVIDTVCELDRLRGSKYVQSAIGGTFKEIKSCLKNGKIVLFTGCGCQVAGLKSYLGEDYDNLITVDILCHGAPSPKSFRKFIDSVVLDEYPEEKIVDFQFRNKKEWGWAPSLYAKLSNGYVYSKSKTQNSWYPSFLNILNCRESCGQCQFNKLPRQGDITLGDFWGIDAMPQGWNDGKGASIVTLNTDKGRNIYDNISACLVKSEQISLDVAKGKNGNLVSSSVSHKNRSRFFKLQNMYEDYGKITEYALKRKFDIGYVGWWYGKNYGSVMTNFALEQYIESLGYSVLMLEWPEKRKPFSPVEDSFARRFANKYYERSIRRTYEELPDLNWFCDMFLVGSDQLWNYWSTKENGSYFFLDFVNDSRKKIAYATSFGHSVYGAPRNELEKNAFHLNRFDYISVREKDGIDLCHNVFGVEAQWAIEPVFLLDRGKYEAVAEQSEIKTDAKYMLAYILTPSVEKRDAIQALAERMGLNVILILDAQSNIEENKQIMDMPESIRENIEMEDWLKYIKDAELVVTDSFHGTCFSIIFERQFICIGNPLRGLSRFITLLETCRLEDRMVLDASEIIDYNYDNEIDYRGVQENMSGIIAESKKWLSDALRTPKAYKASAYDMLLQRIKELEHRVLELEK